MSPMKKELYPAEWSVISFEIRDAADWVCQECDMQCRKPGEPFDTHRRTLTVAHWDHDTEAPEVFLVALCPTCHNAHDVPYRVANRKRRIQQSQPSLFTLTA